MTTSKESQKPTEYIHGDSAEEQARLSKLNELLNTACLRPLKLQSEQRILDVGSGLGQFTRLMARTASSSNKVVGIERNENQLLKARELAAAVDEADLVDFRKGDAYNFPLQEEEWNSFDLVHTRFLLEHVADPAKVVANMARAVRPGGRIVLADDDHDILRLYPSPAGFIPLWEAYMRTYDRLGYDPYIGRRLVSLMHEAGLQPLNNDFVFFGSCAGHPDFEAFAENLICILQQAKTPIVSAGLLNEKSFDIGIQQLIDWRQLPNAAIWYAVSWAEGILPH